MKTHLVKCPECGHENRVADSGDCGPQIGYCDCELGGCDRYFAYTVKTTYTVKAFKIEGQKERSA